MNSSESSTGALITCSSLDDGSLPDGLRAFTTTMSDLGLSGVTMLPLDCSVADRVRLLDRPLTGGATATLLTAEAFHGFTAT